MNSLPPDAQAIKFGKQLPRVYISGPYSKPDPQVNLARTAAVCSGLARTGLCLPYAPLLFCHAWEERSSMSYEFWIEYTKHLLVGADLLYRIPGESEGADGEVDLARKMEIPVLVASGNSGADDAEALMSWLSEWHLKMAPPWVL